MTQKSVYSDILKNAVINHNSQEIENITSAMEEMLNRLLSEPIGYRLMREVERREVKFRVSRLQLCGSMAEKTSLWKSERRHWGENKFIEFDYLAVLEKDGHEINIVNSECPACNHACFEKYELDNNGFRRSFQSELDLRVTAMCNCTINTDCIEPGPYKHTCDKCTVVRKTGRLQIVKLADLNWGDVRDQEHCSLIFCWISNTNSLLAPNIETLQLTEVIQQLVIRVDVMFSFEYDDNGEDQNKRDTFVIPKRCAQCQDDINWMVSYCLFEISTISSLSVKHRNCYIIIKFLYGQFTYWTESDDYCKPYHAKVALLTHCETCRDDSNNYTNCIKDILRSLINAYTSWSFKMPQFHPKQSLPIRDDMFNKNAVRTLPLPVLCMLHTLSDVISEQCHSVHVVVNTLKQTIRQLLDGKLLMSFENDFPVLRLGCSEEAVGSILGHVIESYYLPGVFDPTDELRGEIMRKKSAWVRDEEIKDQVIRSAKKRFEYSSADPRLPRTISLHVKSDNPRGIVTRSGIQDSMFSDELLIIWPNDEDEIKGGVQRGKQREEERIQQVGQWEEELAQWLSQSEEEELAQRVRQSEEELAQWVRQSEEEELAQRVRQSEGEELAQWVRQSEEEELAKRVRQSEEEELAKRVKQSEGEELAQRVRRSEEEELAKRVRQNEGEELAQGLRQSEEDIAQQDGYYQRVHSSQHPHTMGKRKTQTRTEQEECLAKRTSSGSKNLVTQSQMASTSSTLPGYETDPQPGDEKHPRLTFDLPDSPDDKEI